MQSETLTMDVIYEVDCFPNNTFPTNGLHPIVLVPDTLA